MRRPDASMSLLTDLQADALEPGYRMNRHRPPSRARLLLAVGLVAALITVALLQTTRGAGAAETQRSELLERVSAARSRQSDLNEQVARLDTEIRGLSELEDPAEREELQTLELAAGAAGVEGPGIVVTVSDDPGATGTQGLVLDGDLSRLVNGLWQAGAEAIAVNGRRISTLTPIRAAGAAITVDFVSLSPPYRVEAIGDPATLQARFNETAGASWWQFITMNYGLTMTIAQADGDLVLPPDPGQAVRHAKRR